MNEKGIAILEVSGEGCANCISLLPVLKRITDRMGLPLAHIEADAAHAEEIGKLQIERVPTVLVFKDGKEVARCTGYQPEEILEVWLEAKASE